jgi:hypothetical protein
MGLVIEDETNPFRPKRFRSLFRTACGLANIDSGYTMAFMGHAGDMSASYLEKPAGMFLKEYIRVEPWVTVYGVDKAQVAVIAENLDDIRQELKRFSEENASLKDSLNSVGGFSSEDNEKIKLLLSRFDSFIQLSDWIERKEVYRIDDPELLERFRKMGKIK